jgi:hypothetical protein
MCVSIYLKLLMCTITCAFSIRKEIRESDKKLILLVPSPGPLPSRYLQLGSIKWIE